MIRMKSDHHTRTPSCVAVATDLPKCRTAASLSCELGRGAAGALGESVQQMLRHASAVDARNGALT